MIGYSRSVSHVHTGNIRFSSWDGTTSTDLGFLSRDLVNGEFVLTKDGGKAASFNFPHTDALSGYPSGLRMSITGPTTGAGGHPYLGFALGSPDGKVAANSAG